MFYIICHLASQWAVLNYLCESERQNGRCQLKWRVSSLLWSVKKHRGVFSSKKMNIILAETISWSGIVYSTLLEVEYFVLHLMPTLRTHRHQHLSLCFAVCTHTHVLLQKGVPRYSEESVLQLERELVQARLKEAESQCALKEMQDKILDMEKVGFLGHDTLLRF